MKKHLLPLLAVILAVIFWGLSFLSIKVVVTEIPPATMAWLRQIPSLLTLLILMHRSGENFRIDRRDWLSFGAATLFGIVLYSVFENSGMQFTDPSTASMLVAAIPVFVLLIESAAKRRQPDLFTLSVILVSIVGVYLVLFDGGTPDFASSKIVGNLLVLGAMGCWIIFTFINSRLGLSYSSLKLTTVQTLFALGLFIPFALTEMPRWQVPSSLAIWNLVFLGVFCSAVAYVLYFIGMRALGPVLPSALLNLLPVVTILAMLIVFHEAPSWIQIIGAILIIGSLSALSLHKVWQAQKRHVPVVVTVADAEQARLYLDN